jgi:DNA-directed RNA polymerase specialized sigma24 family protein
MDTQVSRAMPSCGSHLSSDEFKSLGKICANKCAGVPTSDREDIYSGLCESALRKHRSQTGQSLHSLINNKVFWEARKACGVIKNRQGMTETIPDHQCETLAADTDDISPVEDRLLVEHLANEIPKHLLVVAQMRIDGYSNDEIAAYLQIPRGTVQYHFESFQRKAKRSLARIGIHSLSDIYPQTAAIAA